MRAKAIITLCVFGSCFVIVALWPFKEIVALVFGGLVILAILVYLGICIDEQRLRHERLRPSSDGYEIPLGQSPSQADRDHENHNVKWETWNER